MLPHNFEQANVNAVKPDTWQDEDCLAMPVCLHPLELHDGRLVAANTSFWKPSKEDLDALNNGGGIYVTQCSGSIIPIALSTESPFSTDAGS